MPRKDIAACNRIAVSTLKSFASAALLAGLISGVRPHVHFFGSSDEAESFCAGILGIHRPKRRFGFRYVRRSDRGRQ
jgi:hypothetical protein